MENNKSLENLFLARKKNVCHYQKSKSKEWHRGNG